MITRLFKRLRQFRDDTHGGMALEFVVIVPILFWTFGALYVFFDGYRQSTVNLKAAYTIGDVLSRETQAINNDYMDTLYSLHGFLTRAGSPTTLRVTVVRWDEDDDRYYRDWSATRGGIEPLTNDDMLSLKEKLPVMPDAERVILVETTNTYRPLLNVGLDTTSLDNFVFTRPRFAPQLVWES